MFHRFSWVLIPSLLLCLCSRILQLFFVIFENSFIHLHLSPLIQTWSVVFLIFFICAIFLLFSPFSWCLHILGYGTSHLDMKPWDDETDIKKLKEAVLSVQMEGLLWGASKLVPVGYGMKKLHITLTIVDDSGATLLRNILLLNPRTCILAHTSERLRVLPTQSLYTLTPPFLCDLLTGIRQCRCN